MAAKTRRLEVSRRSTRTKSSRVALTAEEISIAATRYMAGAEAHQRASAWCLDKPDAKPPNIDALFFPTVSFELILLSVEQSLRLVLLLHYSIIRDDTSHTPDVLYGAIRNKSSGYEGVRSAIVERSNMYGATLNITVVTEKEVVACLKKHNASYANFRYFQLSHQGRLNPNFGYSHRDVQVMHCLASALIHVNLDEMRGRNIGVIESMSVVPEAQDTAELRAIRDNILSKAGRY